MSDTSCVTRSTASSVCCIGAAGAGNELRAGVDLLRRDLDQGLDLARRRAGALGELPHLGGDHGEAGPARQRTRAASTAALSARMLVWNEIASITR